MDYILRIIKIIIIIMCYSYSTHQHAGRLEYLQGKDHSRAFNAEDQNAPASLPILCLSFPGQCEVGSQRAKRVKCCHQLSPLRVVCSHLGTNRDHRADCQNKYTVCSEAASHCREEYWLPEDWANPTAFWKQRMGAGKQPPTQLN